METRFGRSRESPRHAAAAAAAGPKPRRACANCARLKMKCRWPDAGAGSDAGCSRCARMKLACHVPAAAEAAPRKRGTTTRVAQLEHKIDGIVSLLAAHKHIQEHGPRDAAAPDPAAFELSPGGFRLGGDEALRLLNTYKRELMHNYPFVVVPASVDAHALHADSPGLFWAVMAAVAPQSAAVQRDVRQWLRQYLADHVVVKQEKTLQLLQTILVHLAWGDYHFYVCSDATNLLQLAMALVIDLRLDKSPELAGGTSSRALLGEAWTTVNRVPYRLGVPHTAAEKRALLGYYHVSSLVSCLFRRGPQLVWNSYLSQCCESLVAAREHDSDLYLAAVVRMQRIADRVYTILPCTGSADDETAIYRPPHDVAINSVRCQLDGFAETQSGMVTRHSLFWACYHVQVMRLYEPIVCMRAPPASSPDAFPAESPFQRTEALWRCLQSAADCFAALLAMPASQLPSLPLTVTGILAIAIVTTSRLLLLEASSDWQPELARQKLDFAAVLQHLADWFQQADGWAEQAGRRRRFNENLEGVACQYTAKLRCLRQWYLSKTSRSQPSLDGPAVASQWPDAGVDLDMIWPEFVSMQDPSVQVPGVMMGWLD